jgi:hypothetical protein
LAFSDVLPSQIKPITLGQYNVYDYQGNIIGSQNSQSFRCGGCTEALNPALSSMRVVTSRMLHSSSIIKTVGIEETPIF